MTVEGAQLQPCVSCGRPTGPGTSLFSDRRTTPGPDGAPIHLCGDCNERAVSQYGRRLTDHDMVQIAARAAGLGMGSAGGIGGGGGPGGS
jgi:hypothetical protein